MKGKAKVSLYRDLARTIEKERHRSREAEIAVGVIIRNLRLERGLRGVDLCRQAGDLDPRTLTAVEKGRIKNPSLKTLQSLARGLGLSISDLFRRSEAEGPPSYQTGTQKGFYELDFRSQGIKVVSFTPFMGNFFCGKLILGAKRRFEEKLLTHPHPIYASVLVGRFDFLLEGKNLALREGDNVFFRGNLRHSFYNPLQRESILLFITAPSFFK